MEIVIENSTRADLFAGLFQHMKIFTENMNVYFNTEHLFIQAMDSSHVSICEIKLPSTWFDVYNVTESVMLGINTNIMFKVLHSREKSHSIKVVHRKEDMDKLEISLISQDTSVYDKNYAIPLVDIDNDLMLITPMEYQADITFPSAVFSTLIDQMKMFGETLSLKCSEEGVEMSSQSQECGKMFMNIPIDDLNAFAIEEDENLDMAFSLIHLKNFCMFGKMSKEVDINLKRDFPIKLVYTLDHDDARAMFYLAPKIPDE
jgi:proliferating cell nuclear antigen